MDKSAAIYVAGHSGLIGSAMERRLRKAGYDNLLLAAHGDLELADPAAVEAFFSRHRPEYVVLAAGRVGGIVENVNSPADFLAANLAIQLNVIQAAHRHDVKKLILFGSSCMYPRECPQPMAEDALLTGRPEPTSMAYATAKLAGVQLCLAYNAQYGEQRFLPVIPNSAYGPNDNFDPETGHVLSALIARMHEAKSTGAESITLWGTGAPRREFVHADDIADACLTLLERDASDLALPLNIGAGGDVSIRELAERIAGVVGYGGELEWDVSRPDGAPRKLLDSGRLRAIGWRPQIDLADGLADAYRWYLDALSAANERAEDPERRRLTDKARWVWRETLRVHRVAPETRLASSLSSVEIFTALYYGGVVRFDPAEPLADQRDRCIISKGHGSVCMYPILADLGFFPKAELEKVCQEGSFLGGIPDPIIPGYETVNGSLGHGLGVASGVALGLRGRGSDRSVFVVAGDGELHEGANWEAIMFAAQHRLDNLNLVVDNNKVSMLGYTDDIISQSELPARLTAFGWDCSECDGHDVAALAAALHRMKRRADGRPKALIAHTLKGRGVPGLENAPLSHVINPKPELIDELLEAGS